MSLLKERGDIMPIQAKTIYEGFSDDNLITVRNAKTLLAEHRLAHRFRPSAVLSDREASWLICLLNAISSGITASDAMRDMSVDMGLGRDPVEVALADKAERDGYVETVLSVPPLREVS